MYIIFFSISEPLKDYDDSEKKNVSTWYNKKGMPEESLSDCNCLEKKGVFFLMPKRYLASIYWHPNLKKTSTKIKLTTEAPKCSLKLLTKSITSVFKLMSIQIKSYNKQNIFLSCIRLFWNP